MPKPTLDADTILKRAAPVTGQHAHEIQPFGHLVRMPIALSEHACKESVDNLNQLLADTMTLRDLYKKNHWQVAGPTFYQFHLLFDKHHDEQNEVVDAVAERVQLLFHVPSADAVVCGDVIYNNVHMMMYEVDAAKREAWIASVDTIAALNPKIVVAGHKSVGAADRPENLAASQQYLRDFTTLAKKGGTVENLVDGMLELHGERDQPHTLWISARAELARRA